MALKRDAFGFDEQEAKRARIADVLAAASTVNTGAGTDIVSIIGALLGGAAATNRAAMPVSSGSVGGGSVGGYGVVATSGAFDTLNIPTSCVGWLKGKQGAMIREIEGRSGATVSFDQSNDHLGHCAVHLRGREEEKKKAYGLIVAEVMKVADQSGTSMDCSTLGTKLEILIDVQYVGWVKGPKGKVVQDITNRSGTRIDVDQVNAGVGHALVKIFGTHEGVQNARELVAFELAKVNPEAAAQITGGLPPSEPPNTFRSAPAAPSTFSAPLAPQLQTQNVLTNLTELLTRAASNAAPAAADFAQATRPIDNGVWEAMRIPSTCVGWLKGRQGAMIREIEGRSGAQVDFDQSGKDQGHCTVQIRGGDEEKKKAYGLVVAEVMKVADQSAGTMDCSALGTKLELNIDLQYVGWVKGPQGKVVKDITTRSCTRIDVDQTPSSNVATVKIFGTHEAVQVAKELIARELSKVSPEAALEVAGAQQGSALSSSAASAQTSDITSLISQMITNPSGTGCAQGRDPEDDGRSDMVQIPNVCVGWLKGRQGGMIREIESRSGAVVDIDQSTKDLGYSIVQIRGALKQKRTAHGLVIAEVMKVADTGVDGIDCTALGAKLEVQISTQYVGWVKGPKGKVVQEMQLKSGTRIDVDQTSRDSGVATIKIYGTREGTEEARQLIAAELSKVSPEAAAEVLGGLPPSAPAPTAASGGYLPASTAYPSSGYPVAAPTATRGADAGSLLAGLLAAAGSAAAAGGGMVPGGFDLGSLQQQQPAPAPAHFPVAAPQLTFEQQVAQLSQQLLEQASRPPLANPSSMLGGYQAFG